MTKLITKRSLVIFRHSPYGSGLAKASLDVVLAAAAFDQDVALLFLGDGVLTLYPDQQASAVGRKSLSRQLAALPLYDIDRVYVDSEAAARYRLDLTALGFEACLLQPDEMRRLMLEFDHLMSF